MDDETSENDLCNRASKFTTVVSDGKISGWSESGARETYAQG